MNPEPAFLSELDGALQFRIPALVSEIRVFRDHDAFPVCPHCQMTLEREYQAYCDRCGQALDWSKLYDARIVLR